MRRGTTPTIIFNMGSTDMDMISDWFVTLRQDSVIITKTNDDLTISKTNATIELRLSEAETMSFRSGEVELQIRAITIEGDRVAGEIKTLPLDRIIYNEVI